MPGGELRVGARSKAVQALRQRLIQSGDLDSVAGGGTAFDFFVEAAVDRFQARHGITPSGAVDEATLSEMNIPAAARLAQLQTNIVRLRSFSGFLGQRYVVTNIPAAQIETVENGQVVTRHAAGVGKIDRQSPIMTTRAIDINFNPFWTVPVSIIKKDLIPRMRKDMNYLSEEKIRIYNKARAGGSGLAGQLELRGRDAFHLPPGSRRRRQFARHGAHQHRQSLRRLHARHAREGHFRRRLPLRLLGLRARAECARLRDLAAEGHARLDPRQDRQGDRSGQRIDVKLAQPVPVYWVYLTAWATPDGIVNFRDDIYKRERRRAGPDGVGPPATPLALPQE